MVLRGQRLLILVSLRSNVLDAAHQGYPGKDSMLRNLRLSVWWLGMATDVSKVVAACVPCAASVGTGPVALMEDRGTPERLWSE